MSNFSDQLEEIKSIISSGTKANKSFAYSTLLHLQQQSSDNHGSVQALARSSQTLIYPIVTDIQDEDEEIATQALKCLGFMIYHPSIVAEITVDDVKLVLESLAKLITTTRMKSVCNLGVWCISIQQLSASLLAAHFHSILLAVVHAIDNPIGSLSTTFEAIQAVMKLAPLLSENMRDLSHIWAPPIYRRLVSFDKRERDMSERCLLKIRSIIIPPPLNLSKAVVKDLKSKLLTGMHNMLSKGMKVQTIQAWGWFIRLLGSHALKNRQLINEMLKIPELTFRDHDSQIQISSQVAWQGLIDALVHPSIILCEINAATEENSINQRGTCKGNSSEIQKKGSLKSIKLIMTPLIGIIKTNCDASVHLACLNTWCYLLHKLEISLNESSVIKLVVEPIFEAVFQIDHDSKNIWTRKFCIELLEDFILANCKDVDYDSHTRVSDQLSAKTCMDVPFTSGNYSWKQYPIKWLPWNLSMLDFHLKMIYILICQASRGAVSHGNRITADDTSLRLFRSVLKGVQLNFKGSSINYNDIMLCLNAILKFIKNICEVSSDGSGRNDVRDISLQLVEAVSKELEPAVVGSTLYNVPLDIEYVKNLNRVADIGYENSVVCSIAYMDMVSPIVYLTVLYFCVVVESTLSAPKSDFILQGMKKYFKFLLSSFDPLETLAVTCGLMYKHGGPSCLRMWTAIAEALKFYLNDVKDFSISKMDSNSNYWFSICYLFAYPLVVCSCTQKDFMSEKIRSSLEDSQASLQLQMQVELEEVITLWMSLYGSICTSLSGFTIDSFSETLFLILDNCLDKHTNLSVCADELELSFKDMDLHLVSLYGDVLICILESFLSSELTAGGNNKHGSNCKVSSGITCCWKFAIRYMNLLQTKIKTDAPISRSVASRVYSTLALFMSSLQLKEDILSIFEIISSPLLQWLVLMERLDESTGDGYQLLWSEMLNSLRRSQPPIIFDSVFLNLHAPILEKTLDHPNLSISEPTITFWNSTYGEQTKLDYPQALLHVLDKLWRTGRINLQKRSVRLQRCQARPEVATAPPRHRVSATYNRGSKRVELVEDACTTHAGHRKMLLPSMKKKRLDLTEHQKEVRRAQQGRERDCGGHGPGVQTFTRADFSQGNDEESQEIQDIRNAECILELLKKR